MVLQGEKDPVDPPDPLGNVGSLDRLQMEEVQPLQGGGRALALQLEVQNKSTLE